MNCQDIADILDDGNVARLDLAQRRDIEAHLTGCADCARDWRLHGAFAALPDMPVPAGFAGRCRALVAAAGNQTISRRARSGIVLGGVLVAFAAAAALLVLPRQAATPAPPPESVQRNDGLQQEAQPVRSTRSGDVDDDAASAQPLQVDAGPLFTARLTSRFLDRDGAPATDEPDPYSPEVRALVDSINRAPARVRAMEALRTALLTELRTVPGLTVVDENAPVSADPAARQFRLNIGPVTMTGLDGNIMRPEDRYVDVILDAVKLRPAGNTERVGAASARIDLQATCNGVDPCDDVAGSATKIVRELVRRVFPVSNPLPVAAQSAPPEARIQALIESFSGRYNNDPADLRDPALVREVLALAATADAARRAQLWRLMRGVGSPELIQPLLASAVQDSDDARLQAVATLAADFAGDPRVQETLETVAGTDARTLVRAVARRGLDGEEAWKQYVVSSLNDAGKLPAERLEAVVYHLQQPGMTRHSYDMDLSALRDLGDDDIQTLARLMPEGTAAFPAGESQVGTLLSNMGYSYSRQPAVVDTLLYYLENGTSTRTRRIAGEVLVRTSRTVPRVRDALRRSLNSDPDQTVRDYVRELLGDDPLATTP